MVFQESSKYVQVRLKGMSSSFRGIPRSFKEVSSVSRKFHGHFKKVSWVFQGKLKGVFSGFRGYLKEIQIEFEGSFKCV